MIVVCADSAPLKYRFRLDPVISPSVCYEDFNPNSSLFDPGATGLLSLSIHHSNAPVLILLKNRPFILERGS
jgi:hypothetical protein